VFLTEGFVTPPFSLIRLKEPRLLLAKTTPPPRTDPQEGASARQPSSFLPLFFKGEVRSSLSSWQPPEPRKAEIRTFSPPSQEGIKDIPSIVIVDSLPLLLRKETRDCLP